MKRMDRIYSKKDGKYKCLYKHFKGNTYRVLFLGKESETLEEVVIYQDVAQPSKIWVRPVVLFTEKVDKEKYPEVEQEYRFQHIDEEIAKTL